MANQYDIDKAARDTYQEELLQDASIYAKATAHHAAQFKEKFPSQVEQIMRLIAERLQQGLRKDAAKRLTTTEVKELAIALESMFNINTQQ